MGHTAKKPVSYAATRKLEESYVLDDPLEILIDSFQYFFFLKCQLLFEGCRAKFDEKRLFLNEYSVRSAASSPLLPCCPPALSIACF